MPRGRHGIRCRHKSLGSVNDTGSLRSAREAPKGAAKVVVLTDKPDPETQEVRLPESGEFIHFLPRVETHSPPHPILMMIMAGPSQD